MGKSFCVKVAICIIALSLGFAFLSCTIGSAYAFSHHHHHNYYSYWYYPYYSYWYYPSYWNSYYGYYSYSQPMQYQLTVNTDPSTLSSQVTGGGSYSQGSSATFSTQNMIQVTKDTRYVFSHWSGDYSSASATGSITMDAPKTVTAIYQLQYYLTATMQPSNTALSGNGWHDAGDTVALTTPSQISSGDSGTRLVLNRWNEDGTSNQESPALNVQMNAPHTVVAEYKQQYYLRVSTDQGVPSGEGWYDAGTYAQINVSTPPNPSYGVSIIFNGWQGDVQSTGQSTRVLMDSPKSIIATWRTDATVLYVTITAVIVAIILIAGAGLYSLAQRGRRTNIAEVCSRCGKSIQPPNNYCPSCGAPRRLNMNVGSKFVATPSSGSQPEKADTAEQTD